MNYECVSVVHWFPRWTVHVTLSASALGSRKGGPGSRHQHSHTPSSPTLPPHPPQGLLQAHGVPAPWPQQHLLQLLILHLTSLVRQQLPQPQLLLMAMVGQSSVRLHSGEPLLPPPRTASTAVPETRVLPRGLSLPVGLHLPPLLLLRPLLVPPLPSCPSLPMQAHGAPPATAVPMQARLHGQSPSPPHARLHARQLLPPSHHHHLPPGKPKAVLVGHA